MSTNSHRPHLRTAPPTAPWVVLVVALLLTSAATTFVAVSTNARDEVRFENAVQSASDRVLTRMDIYVATLRGASALFAADREVDAEEFARYIDRLELQRWHPGIQGVGWSERLATNLPDSVDERYSIRFIEPLNERNRRAIGFDMYAEARRRATKRRARDVGEPAVSGRVTLVQESAGSRVPGFLLYLPVYRDGVVPETIEERRSNLLGFVYAPFRAQDLFNGIFGSEEDPRVTMTVYDGEEAVDSALLAIIGDVRSHSPRRRSSHRVEVAGRTWTLAFASRPAFEAGSALRLVPLVFVAGLIASVWLFILARGQARARITAEEANATKSEFLARMSHELRTPLNAIGGYVDLMLLEISGAVTPAQRDYLDRMQRAQRHLLGLINDILHFARLDAGHVEYDLQTFDIRELAGEVVSMVSVQSMEREQCITVQDGEGLDVIGDREKVRQILINLLSNAVKFTPQHGGISIRWQSVNGKAEISVRDTGIGIPNERQSSIFEPFVQLDSNHRRGSQGTGLGLAISRELARGMAGDVTVESEGADQGSTFTLVLPTPDSSANSAA